MYKNSTYFDFFFLTCSISIFYICRQHFAFVEDCLDAFILAAAMNVMGITELDEQPKEFKPSQFLEIASHDEQYDWLSSLAQEILDRHVTQDKGKFIFPRKILLVCIH